MTLDKNALPCWIINNILLMKSEKGSDITAQYFFNSSETAVSVEILMSNLRKHLVNVTAISHVRKVKSIKK